jgi:hypothetical protein
MAESNIRRNIRARIVSRLESIGKEMIRKAYKHGATEWIAHTSNLDAGFLYVVYYNGTVAYNTDRERAWGFGEGINEELLFHRGWDAKGIPDGTALDWIPLWFDRYKPRPKGFQLVIANATYYSEILEGGYNSKRKYKVLTYLFNELKHEGENNFPDASVSVEII